MLLESFYKYGFLTLPRIGGFLSKCLGIWKFLQFGEKEMGEESRIHMFGEVTKHNQNKDCWLIIHGKVYDVSLFMEDHPGSGEVLLAATGKDATGDFEDIGHSDSAKEMMDKYYIGEIDASTIPAKHQKIQSHSPSYNRNKSNDLMKKVLQFLLPLVILGIAFVTRHWTKTE